MRTIFARNVHQALPEALDQLYLCGIERPSRNGPVLQYPSPVTTVYQSPRERVIFWPERDANPFFHLYESLWMLSGRNDVESVAKFAQRMREFSDDGQTFHGAYGFRWRNAWDPTDQLVDIAKLLKANPTERRAVLQMWDVQSDLGRDGKDLPCNLMATFQINPYGTLDLAVFCRSNDIVWGAYGANAVHFSVLLEYMAAWIGVPVGRYYQISVNWHGYLSTIEPLKPLIVSRSDASDPYASGLCEPVPLVSSSIGIFDERMRRLLEVVDQNFPDDRPMGEFIDDVFFQTAYSMFYAHHLWKTLPAPERFERSMGVLDGCPVNIDWIRAGKEWIQRRWLKWTAAEEPRVCDCKQSNPPYHDDGCAVTMVRR